MDYAKILKQEHTKTVWKAADPQYNAATPKPAVAKPKAKMKAKKSATFDQTLGDLGVIQ